MMIGISRKASTALMRRHASIPSTSDILTSITIRSISFPPAPSWSKSRHLYASWAEEAEWVSRYPASLRILWRSNRASGESSTRRIFMKSFLSHAGHYSTSDTGLRRKACPPVRHDWLLPRMDSVVGLLQWYATIDSLQEKALLILCVH